MSNKHIAKLEAQFGKKHPLIDLCGTIAYWLEQEEIYVSNVRTSGESTDPSFGIFLELVDGDDDEISPGSWAESDILIQLAPDVEGRAMMRVNSMLMQRIAKLVVAVVVGYPS